MLLTNVSSWMYQLGLAARESAMHAHDGKLPPVSDAWMFVKDNPEMFAGLDVWPSWFPSIRPRQFELAYRAGEGTSR